MLATRDCASNGRNVAFLGAWCDGTSSSQEKKTTVTELTVLARRRLDAATRRAARSDQRTQEELLMAAHGVGDRTGATRPVSAARVVSRPETVETKPAFKTTELIAYVVASVLVLVAAMIIDESDAGGYGARQAWLYFTILTVGYMISRGLAKSGSHEHDRDPRTSGHDDDR
jgi:hypothetical protein